MQFAYGTALPASGAPARLEPAVAGEAASTLQESVGNVKESATKVYRHAEASARAAYSRVSQSAQDLKRITTNSAKLAKEHFQRSDALFARQISLDVHLARRHANACSPRARRVCIVFAQL